MAESDHKYKIQLCQEVLSVLQTLEPGLSLGRGDYNSCSSLPLKFQTTND